MNKPSVVPFFARKASEKGLSIKSGVKAGARESALKLTEEKEK